MSAETSLRGVDILDVNERRGAKLRKNGGVSGSVLLESRRPDWMRGRSSVLERNKNSAKKKLHVKHNKSSTTTDVCFYFPRHTSVCVIYVLLRRQLLSVRRLFLTFAGFCLPCAAISCSSAEQMFGCFFIRFLKPDNNRGAGAISCQRSSF